MCSISGWYSSVSGFGTLNGWANFVSDRKYEKEEIRMSCGPGQRRRNGERRRQEVEPWLNSSVSILVRGSGYVLFVKSADGGVNVRIWGTDPWCLRRLNDSDVTMEPLQISNTQVQYRDTSFDCELNDSNVRNWMIWPVDHISIGHGKIGWSRKCDLVRIGGTGKTFLVCGKLSQLTLGGGWVTLVLRLTTVSLLCSSTAWCKMQPFTEAGDGLCLEDRIAQNGVVIKHIYGGERRCCANHATDVLHDAISGNNNLTNVPGNGRFIGSC
ncbi:hypothetical protein VPH35_036607 [Triticum aestivum]|uniref:Uncharacterized protein n=1 Tax=Aegilops tauschii TaxID=37682 RepID=M8C8E5_AEGTA